MHRRELVTFDAEFPDDAQWDEQGHVVVPGGRLIAEAIKDQLQGSAFCSNVSQYSFYGWAFDVTCEDTRVWCLLQTGDAWLLLLEPQESLMRRLFTSSSFTGFAKLQTKVRDILTVDKRFSNVLWYTRAEYERGEKSRARHSPGISHRL